MGLSDELKAIKAETDARLGQNTFRQFINYVLAHGGENASADFYKELIKYHYKQLCEDGSADDDVIKFRFELTIEGNYTKIASESLTGGWFDVENFKLMSYPRVTAVIPTSEVEDKFKKISLLSDLADEAEKYADYFGDAMCQKLDGFGYTVSKVNTQSEASSDGNGKASIVKFVVVVAYKI